MMVNDHHWVYIILQRHVMTKLNKEVCPNINTKLGNYYNM